MRTAKIYSITNVLNGKTYVGSTRHWANRKMVHLVRLRKGHHHSSKLQRSFNKYGENAFVFSSLETCSVEIVLEREAFWIRKLDAFHNGFNMIEDPSTGLSEQQLQRRAESLRRTMASPEYRAKRKKLAREITSRPEYREKQRQSQLRRWAAQKSSLLT